MVLSRPRFLHEARRARKRRHRAARRGGLYAAKGLYNQRHHLVIALFVPRVVVVAPVEGDVALACLVVKGMGSLIQWGGFVPALSEPMTRDCEGSKVGAIPIEEGMMRNGAAPDVGSPLSPGACEVRSPRPPNGHLWAPRVDCLTYLSGTERRGCSWGAFRDSEGRAAAQPPGACART